MASADDSDNVILDASASQSLKKLLACSTCKAYPREGVYSCGNGHSVCSLCIDDGTIYLPECHTEEGGECPVDECKATMMPVTCVKTDFTDMVRKIKLPVPCKERKNGCTDQHIVEKIEEHQSECEYRVITGWVLGKCLFKDFAAKVDNDYIKEQKWRFKCRISPQLGEYGGVFKFFIGPDQRRFCLDIGNITDKDAQLNVCVVGGKEVAKKYKAELRIFSNEKDTSVTYNGPVFPIDNPMHSIPYGEAFYMNPKWFETFNHGHQYFGDHNRDKNGEIVIPVLYKIIKKELDIPTDLVEDGEMHEDKK